METVGLGSETVPKGQKRQETEPLKKTTIAIPLSLWRDARIRAAEDLVDLRAVILAALREYLKRKK